MQTNGKLPCDKDAAVRVKYIIQGEELRKGQEVLDHFYLVRFLVMQDTCCCYLFGVQTFSSQLMRSKLI